MFPDKEKAGHPYLLIIKLKARSYIEQLNINIEQDKKDLAGAFVESANLPFAVL
ncbi:hypothetical protein [Psychromonas sp. MB-3u-54]|uniref:hypothetical protein n=1 Tax=Psychromonas sp. MB-3u-54 TaxID=2058319 RepID=UPI0012FEA406|nr:hypothetical protein [Psychromonas sp. MB-3u-54]